jgi:hypothetical protein
MKICLGLIFLFASATACAAKPLLIEPGQYKFQHHFAEQPSIPSITVDVRIDGRHIVVTNNDKTDVFPHGVLAEGTLMWHSASGQWIIGDTPNDAKLSDVGGCSDGPEVVDLKNHVFWTC